MEGSQRKNFPLHFVALEARGKVSLGTGWIPRDPLPRLISNTYLYITLREFVSLLLLVHESPTLAYRNGVSAAPGGESLTFFKPRTGRPRFTRSRPETHRWPSSL